MPVSLMKRRRLRGSMNERYAADPASASVTGKHDRFDESVGRLAVKRSDGSFIANLFELDSAAVGAEPVM